MAQEQELSIADMIREEPVEEVAEASQEAVEDEINDEEGEDQGSEDDALEAATEDDSPEVSDLVEFEYEGQIIEAPVAIKEALMRQQDYTVKTQELAARSKTIEVVQGEVENRRQQYEFAQQVIPDVLKAQQLEAQVEQTHKYMRDNIDSLSHTDIEKLRMSMEDLRGQRDQIVSGLTSKQKEFQQAQEQAHAELLNKGTEVLRSKFPNWGQEAQKQVRDYALSSGFTEAELSGVVDPRQVEVLYKASQYDLLQQGKSRAVQKVQNAPKISSKARNTMPAETRAKLDLRNKLKSNKLTPREKRNAVIEDIGARWA